MWTMHEDGSVTLKLTIYLFRDSAVARMAFLQLLADSCIISSLTGIFFYRRTGCFILILPVELSPMTTGRRLRLVRDDYLLNCI